MVISRKNLRSLENIRTLSERSDHGSIGYKTFLKISSREMEKARLEKERSCLMEQINKIDERIVQIESDKVILLQSLQPKGNGEQEISQNLKNVPDEKANFVPSQKSMPKRSSPNIKGLKFRY